MDAQQRRRIREIQRRRGRNVNEAPEVRAGWQRCRDLSLAYLDAVIAAHASGCPGAIPDWGKYAHLSPDEQIVRQDADYADWVRHMEDTPWFPGRTLGHPALEALESEIFSAWSSMHSRRGSPRRPATAPASTWSGRASIAPARRRSASTMTTIWRSSPTAGWI